MDQSQNPDVIKDIESPPVPTVTATTTAVPAGTTAASTPNPAGGASSPNGNPTGPGAKKESGYTTDALKKAAASFFSLQTIDLLALNALFSFVMFVPSAQACNRASGGGCPDGLTSYAVAAGVVTFVLNFVIFLLDVAKKAPSETILAYIAIFTFLWWVAAAIVLTFIGPYTSLNTANGYFGTWFAFITASFAVLKGGAKFHERANNTWNSVKRSQRPSFFLFLSSLVVMGAAIGPCSPSSFCQDWNAFAIALSVISMGLCLIILFAGRFIPHHFVRITANLLVLWWIIGTGVVTFGNPFPYAGNGYFGSFVSIFLAFVVARVASDEALEGAE